MSSAAGKHLNGSAAPPVEAPLHVVICGAGPAGLLLAHHLLSFGGGKFKVSIYDKAEDPRESLKKELSHRRYTIGIARRGENSINLVPGLLQRVKKVTVKADSFAMVLPFMSRPVVGKADKKDLASEKSFLVDRFSLCASLMQALEDVHGGLRAKGLLATRFSCGCVGVDLQAQTATFEPQPTNGAVSAPAVETYDLLVGADGLRSAVRTAFQQQVRNFEVETRKLPGTWVVTHFDCPEGFSKGTFHMLTSVPRTSLTGLALPSPDGSLCFILGWVIGENPKEWLACGTPQEARDFIHSRLPYFNITEDAAWKLRSCPPQTSMHVKCWQYHDTKGSAVLIGDAAHCTAPNIGQGCNASLVDACVLARLLLGEVVSEDNRAPDESLREEQKKLWASDPPPVQVREKLPQLLEYFSALQVKEGHALVDLSEANGPLETWAKVLHAVLFLLRFFLWKLLPFLVWPPVMAYAGNTTVPYSRVYQQFRWESDLVLWSNNRMRQRWDAAQGEAEELKAL